MKVLNIFPLILFLVAIINSSNSAYAVQILKSNANWHIKPVTLADGLPPYCYMKNYFPDANISLIISKDAESNTSLAVDFFDDILDKNNQYSMNIVITPNKLNKTLVATAASPSIIVAQIPQQLNFVRNIARGKTLKILLPNANLQFSLDGTLKAEKTLNKCILNLKSPDDFIENIPPIASTNTVEVQKSSIAVDNSNIPNNYIVSKVGSSVADINNNKVAKQAIKSSKKQFRDWASIFINALDLADIDKSYVDKGVYIWKKDSLYGNAQIFRWEAGKSFSQMIDNYINVTKNRCDENFAHHVKKKVTLAGGKTYAIGNIACIGQNTDNAAALFFYGFENKFLVVSHEGTSSQLENALKLRDKLLNYFLARDAKLSLE